jgi:hypothetical protein
MPSGAAMRPPIGGRIPQVEVQAYGQSGRGSSFRINELGGSGWRSAGQLVPGLLGKDNLSHIARQVSSSTVFLPLDTSPRESRKTLRNSLTGLKNTVVTRGYGFGRTLTRISARI